MLGREHGKQLRFWVPKDWMGHDDNETGLLLYDSYDTIMFKEAKYKADNPGRAQS